jgi:hypothetical protein
MISRSVSRPVSRPAARSTSRPASKPVVSKARVSSASKPLSKPQAAATSKPALRPPVRMGRDHFVAAKPSALPSRANVRIAPPKSEASAHPEKEMKSKGSQLGNNQLIRSRFSAANPLSKDGLPKVGGYRVFGTTNGKTDVDNYSAYAIPKNVRNEDIRIKFRSRNPDTRVIHADKDFAQRYPGLKAGNRYLFVNNGSTFGAEQLNISDVYVQR